MQRPWRKAIWSVFLASTIASGWLEARPFIRADANADGVVDISDAIFTLSSLFAGGKAPPCQKAADANDDGALDLSDAVYTLRFLFQGAGILHPYPACGNDLTPDWLDCGPHHACELPTRYDVTRIPVFFHFLYDGVDPATGMPSYTFQNQPQTIHDIDKAVAEANLILADAASTGDRRLVLLRAGVVYSPAPADCPDPVSTIEPHRMYGALNVVTCGGLCGTEGCSGVATAAYAARADAAALFHEIGHLLGLYHPFDFNEDPDRVELLHRNMNPASADSCYRRGDGCCDTPPDYGYLRANGSSEWIVCATLVPGMDLCTQDGPPCDPAEPMVDGQGLCTPIDGGMRGRRVYDPAALGLVEDFPGNVMAYHRRDFLTHDQFLRMHTYTQWRRRLPNVVPSLERQKLFSVWPDDIGFTWDLPTNQENFLAQVQERSWFQLYQPPVHLRQDTAEVTLNLPRDAGRRVLSVSVRAAVTGVASNRLRLKVFPPHGESLTLDNDEVHVDGSFLTADDAYSVGGPLATLRWRRSQGAWQATVSDPGGTLTLGSLSINVITTNSGYLTNDSRGRGLSDVLVYRPSEGRVYVSYNEGTGSADFGSGLLLPGNQAPGDQVFSGDMDGDGLVDLVARSGATYFVARNKEDYWWWGATGPAADPPLATDEVLAGDFDGDGFGDLLARRTDTSIDRGIWTFYRGDGYGGFTRGLPPAFGSSSTAYVADVKWTVGDFDGNGRSDVMVREKGSGLFWISFNITPRPGDTPVFYGGVNPTIGGSLYAYLDTDRLAAMDVNGDGRDDIVVRRQGTGDWITSLSEGASTFSGGVPMRIGGGTRAYLDSDVVLGALP